MYQNILVAVDGSPTSDNALVEAIKLTEQQGSSLHLVHVVDFARAYLKSDTVSQLDDYERALRRAGEEVLDRALATVRSAGLDAKVKLIQIGTINQHASDEVVAEAKRLPADLIVIGTHGRRGFRHLLLGSVAEGVIRQAAQPVLLIRTP